MTDNHKRELVENVTSKQYGISGKLYILEDGHFYIETKIDGKTYGRRLEEDRKHVDPRYQKDIEHDIAWMSLEDLYEDILMEIIE